VYCCTLGVLAAWKHGSLLDRAVMAFAGYWAFQCLYSLSDMFSLIISHSN